MTADVPAGDASVTSAGRTLSAELVEHIRPRRPHDDLPFDELAARYNFMLTDDHRRVFARLVIKECERTRRLTGGPVRVLDIGCGRGIGRNAGFTKAIRAHADELWGIEPDENARSLLELFDHFQHAMMETAELPNDYFDVLYSYMVMEHVADPEGFFRASARCLKPGGVHLFMTPNAAHYFTIAAATMHRLGAAEVILRLIKRGEEEEYHYPVQYKCNSPKRIRKTAQATGYSRCEFAFIESEGPIGYMKGPLRVIYHILRAKRKLIRQKTCLLTLTARMTRDHD